MDCINIGSEDNSVTVVKDECGVDLSVTANNLANILQFEDNDCISFVEEFVDGKLVITPVLDWECVASNISEYLEPPTCPAPISLSVEIV
jgi:hypothetical protein